MKKLVFFNVLLIAVSALMFSAGLVLPGFIIAGVCLSVLVACGGFIPAAISSAVALLICSGVSAGSIVEFLLGGIVPGIAIGLGYIKRLRLPQAMIAPSLSFCGMWAYMFVFYKKTTGNNMFEDATSLIVESFKQSLTALPAENALPENFTKELISVFETGMDVFQLIVPSLVILFSCILSFAVIMISKKLVFRHGGPIVSFSKLYVPSSAIAVTFICGILFFTIKTPFKFFLGNVLILMLCFYFLCGFSTVDFFFRRKLPRTAIRILIYILGFMFLGLIIPQFVYTFIFMVGALDSMFDFRKLRPRKKDKE